MPNPSETEGPTDPPAADFGPSRLPVSARLPPFPSVGEGCRVSPRPGGEEGAGAEGDGEGDRLPWIDGRAKTKQIHAI